MAKQKIPKSFFFFLFPIEWTEVRLGHLESVLVCLETVIMIDTKWETDAHKKTSKQIKRLFQATRE